MPIHDAWDWPMLFYIGTVVLKRSEGAFWRMKPRRLNSLVRMHVKVNGGKKDKPGFIDQIM